MRPFLLLLFIVLASSVTMAQNTDLPSPTANNQTLPAGSYVIAMDNTNQLNNGNDFNIKAYGLVVHLLNDSAKLKWVIKAGKAKDGIDFTVNASPLLPVVTTYTKRITVSNGSTAATVNNATNLVVGMTVTSGSAGIQAGTTITAISGTNITLSLPATATISNRNADFTSYSYPVSSYDFRAGPFVIFAEDTAGTGALINSFNNNISHANDKIKVYKTTASVTVDVRYDMADFVPKAAILDDGGSVDIHVDYMTACNITSANYVVTYGQNLLTDCYTFASEPHNSDVGSYVDNAIVAIKRFVEFGGNFLAQCHAVINYENNALGRFQTTTGITSVNTGAGTAISYPNPDLSFSQFQGNFNISLTGSLRNWRINNAGTNNFHKHTKANSDTTVMGTSVSKLKTGDGGLVFYLGNHNFDDYTSLVEINGIRMYMNAFLTPVTVANYCLIGESYMSPLAAKLTLFQGSESNGAARLNWEINQNESVNHFELERSLDGNTFTSAAVITGNNQTGLVKYSHIDMMPANRVYYRLKITEKDGTARYSRVILLQTKADDSQGLRITSNPVIDRLAFEFRASQPGPAELRIMDMLGRVQLKKTLNIYEGNNTMNLTLPSAWQKGIYIAEVIRGGDRYTAKFIKQQ